VTADFAYLTTVGRVSGLPRTIEIWFAEVEGTLYLLAGGREKADWVRNLRQEPRVRVRIGGPRELSGDLPGSQDAIARDVADPDEELAAREALAAKYYGWSAGDPLDEWCATALPIAIELER
jgi:deazaflavin-dependent oxidoreductase (nitroreductase family)